MRHWTKKSNTCQTGVPGKKKRKKCSGGKYQWNNKRTKEWAFRLKGTPSVQDNEANTRPKPGHIILTCKNTRDREKFVKALGGGVIQTTVNQQAYQDASCQTINSTCTISHQATEECAPSIQEKNGRNPGYRDRAGVNQCRPKATGLFNHWLQENNKITQAKRVRWMA